MKTAHFYLRLFSNGTLIVKWTAVLAVSGRPLLKIVLVIVANVDKRKIRMN